MFFRTFFFIFFCIAFFSHTFSAETKTEAQTKTDACIEARKSRTETSITEYVCPSGDFFLGSTLPLSEERICGSIYVQIEFAKIDKKALEWTEKLQDTRNVNIESWIADIRKKTEEFGSGYTAICSITKMREACGVSTTDFFPETICTDLAAQKARAWENMGYILAGRGIAKNYQNDKDTFIEKTKTKYSKISEKWNQYLRVFDTAVSKFTAYIKKTVK
jgi:hypothetical protein